MVCCALIAIFLAILSWPLRKLMPRRTSPMLWQLVPADDVPVSPDFSFAARVKSFGYAIEGLRRVVIHEHNARVHIAAAALVVTLGFILNITAKDWFILILAIVSVWFAETINTAFEYLCDVVSPEKNEEVKHAKDIAAGAVLITALGAALVGGLVFVPYIVGDSSTDAIILSSLCMPS